MCSAAVAFAFMLLLSVPAVSAQPDEALVEFDLPAQPLADSLRAVASRTNTNLLFDPQLVATSRAPALSGRLTAGVALSRLLAGTGIRYSFISEKTVVLVAAPLPAAAPADAAAASPGGRNVIAARSAARRSSMDAIEVRTIEQVIVTAQKRAERLLEVPMSVSVLTGVDLERRGANTLVDIASMIPGLSTVEHAPAQSRIQLRGISSLNGAPTVGLYLDELPLNVENGFPAYGADIRFIDLDRLEVLRGPQGTLYGEGSMGGTIKYVTRDPDLARTSIEVGATAGAVTQGSPLYRADVVINVPVAKDSFALRFAGSYEKSSGWIDYPRMGLADVNEGESATARLKGLWRPSDVLSATFMWMYQDSDYDSMNLTDHGREAQFVLLQPARNTNRLASLVLQYDAGSFTVLSATGYMKRSALQLLDFTELLGPVYPALGLPAVQSVSAGQFATFEAPSEELRIASKGDGPFKWTAGLYYRNYEEDIDILSRATPNPLPYELIEATTLRRAQQSAVFGELGYRLDPAVDVTVGARYVSERRTQAGTSNNFGTVVTQPERAGRFTSLNPRFIVSYRPAAGTLIYASAAKGFRSGGLNDISARPADCSLPTEFEPEKLWTYELGLNRSSIDTRVVVQAAVYRNEWRDVQALEYCAGSLFAQATNLGSASGTGVDLQLTLRPLDSWTLSLSAGYNDSQYDSTSAAHRAGDPIDFVPDFTAGIAAGYDFQWSPQLPGRLQIDYQYTGSSAVAQRNLDAVARSDAYGCLDARVSLLSGSWQLSLFAQNLTDSDKSTAPAFAGYLAPTGMRPRTVGLEVRYNY